MTAAPLPEIRSLPSWLLGRAAARGRALVADALAAEGLKMWHHVVLSAVRDLAPVAQADLGRGIGLDPKDLVGVLNDLQSAGLVVRVPDPGDRRKNAVSLTEEGGRVLARCEEAARAANDELLAPLTEDERARLMDLVRRVAGTEADG
ncbi:MULTISPECIES: MarR family winged helix-turn-helix transcriptional regulator [Streptomyces]|uniref:MarR family winged helix-turn-helix transcriptional regulator n=1 Tax=Streptomyces salinarius TaxID=2762598 RepID=A0ABW8B650_9ACTN|nr:MULTISPECIES: MarR family winged helix-turn-helix transcriptional regulator [Streptomyces]AZM74473.1 MarR family transcriptional regulator [Streptomyces sp. KPB2]MBH5134466.1 winged helix-turn-helix transcriptional regulator [Streptomyces sp. HB-N217]MCQ4201024.1 MarR family winged helix-turn-helix transcriptional regulator [Streptomyces coelicoflavus]MDU0257371.1 MarR family winged helix-turn-helix transcriptional regulator [Streptomyces sp. PU10]NDZ75729.1 winged helix-turn-helix transcri